MVKRVPPTPYLPQFNQKNEPPASKAVEVATPSQVVSAQAETIVSGDSIPHSTQEANNSNNIGAANVSDVSSKVSPLDSSGKRPIPVDLIDDSPFQPRLQYDQDELEDLASSMYAAGLREAIIVREKPNGRYEINGRGHRRLRAAKLLKWTEIDAYVENVSDKEAELSTFISNESRVDLSDYERGKMYNEVFVRGYAKTQKDVGQICGASQSRVSRCLKMLKLPSQILAILDAHPSYLSADEAEEAMKLMEGQPDIIDTVVSVILKINEEKTEGIKSTLTLVERIMKELPREQKTKETVRRAIPIVDTSGAEAFSIKVKDNFVGINIINKKYTSQQIEKAIHEVLKTLAE